MPFRVDGWHVVCSDALAGSVDEAVAGLVVDASAVPEDVVELRAGGLAAEGEVDEELGGALAEWACAGG